MMSSHLVKVERPMKRSERTRQALLAAARTLFSTQGYEASTLEQVAEEAGLHVQTLYRHFPNKRALATADTRLVLDELEEALATRETGVSTFDVWRQLVKKYADRSQAGPSKHLPFSVVALDYVFSVADYVDILASGLAQDFGDSRDNRRPFLVACMLKAANDVVALKVRKPGRKGALTTQLLEVVDDVEAFCKKPQRP